ncbi:hypothetical protein HaLaN_31683, partial [Haematococcus lacustris]
MLKFSNTPLCAHCHYLGLPFSAIFSMMARLLGALSNQAAGSAAPYADHCSMPHQAAI